ncbi:hypothetical protein ACUNWD_12360 [Sunxiuqinia sp. A32]|uniref:hypothetical protein n=1 Tax=Sunxiuqinia sp. A32 TaxID=3461496 RepID=UPI0040462CD0
MQTEQISEETSGVFFTIREFIDTLEESTDSKSQVSGILTLLKSIIQLLEAGGNVRSHQSEFLNSLNESLQANVKVLVEHDQRITKLNELVTEIAKSASSLSQKVKKLAENTAKLPAINVDNLLKTLNEHADEINKNTTSIIEIKDKLEFP